MQNIEFFMMFPSDSNRFVSEGNLAIDDNTINVPGLGTKGTYWNSICAWGRSF